MSIQIRLCAALATGAAMIAPAAAQRIHTGGDQGAYHRDFCPALSREMAASAQSYACTTSSGTRENMERVRAQPRDFGYAQFDVFALEGPQLAPARTFQIARQDDARECVFAVTRNKDVTSFGEMAAYATTLRFYLPPQASGSSGTFRYLRQLDRNGIGRAEAVTYTASVDEAIRAALANDRGVALFVQFPDPDNERFRAVRELGGHFVPVIDRIMLSQQVDGRPVYIAKQTPIENGRSIVGGLRVTTSCTPMVVFTGHPDRIRDASEQRAHQDLIAQVRQLPLDQLVPRQSVFRQVAQRTRELTAEGRTRFLAYSARARDQALPWIERMIERAAPRLD
jgi:hypothetical protein